MIELPVPLCAAPEEMLMMTPSPDSRRNGTKARIVAKGPRTLAVSTWSIKSSSSASNVVRHHAGKAGGIDQDVGAAELLADRRGDLLDLGGVLKRQMHRLME